HRVKQRDGLRPPRRELGEGVGGGAVGRQSSGQVAHRKSSGSGSARRARSASMAPWIARMVRSSWVSNRPRDGAAGTASDGPALSMPMYFWTSPIVGRSRSPAAHVQNSRKRRANSLTSFAVYGGSVF